MIQASGVVTVAYVTPIGANPEQIEYRLGRGHGCTTAEASKIQFGYHVDNRERPLVWTGAGLVEVGIVPGSELSEDQFDKARALMAGKDPREGNQLVEPKRGVFEDAKVALGPLVRAVQAHAHATGVDPEDLFKSSKNVAAAYGRAVRAVANDGEAAALRADDAGRIADAAGVDIGAVWGEQTYADAVANLTETKITTAEDGTVREEIGPRRKIVGNMGYDISFTLPKSHSLLLAFADEDTAAKVEQVYTDQVGATFDWLESQTAYGMRGKHGGGHQAETIATSGFLGWTMVHRAARPTGERLIGDPHWHVHTTIANMARGQDGQWSTVAAGGRDLMRHIPAADHVLKALIRHQLTDELGVEFARSDRTGAWEVAAIPDETLRVFSKRGASIAAMLTDLGFDPGTATRRAEDLAAAQTRHGKTHATAAADTTLRQMWQDEAREEGIDPDLLAAAALPRTGRSTGDGPGGTAPAGPTAGPGHEPGPGPASTAGASPPDTGPTPTPMSAEELERDRLRDVVARLLDPDTGLTSSMRRFTRVDAIAAVADAMAAGAVDVQEIEQLTDQALQDNGIVYLPASGPDGPGSASTPLRADTSNGARHQLGAAHMNNADRWTTADVVAAERVILTAAGDSRAGQGAAAVPVATAELARATVEAVQPFPLSDEQARILQRLVTSDRAIDAVLGPPGTGKTTLMRAARVAWEGEGYVVAGAATAAVAAQNLATESGIESRTVAQWVQSIRDPRQTGLQGIDVLVLDEANLTDDRDRAVLYSAAGSSGTKIVEVGDPKQLRGVGCGSLFGRVHKLVGGAELTVNRRQVDEDERAAIAAWRQQKYATALTSWSGRGRLVATENSDEALTEMIATWMWQRTGAPDPHAEIRGVVMLAASNANVDRLNDAAQAVRASIGETGDEHTYAVRAGRTVRLREGDHVMIRLNDRQQRMHEGPDVLNGYRGVIEAIDEDASVHVVWQQETDDGIESHTAHLSTDFIGAGGLSLGYAMTGHKAEGLTVKADWVGAEGEHQGGTVLVYAPGMDEPGTTVATSRHRDRMFLFAGLDQAEDAATTEDRGDPSTTDLLAQRVIAGLAAQARARSSNANDRPVSDDLAGVRRQSSTPTTTAPATATTNPQNAGTAAPRTDQERPMSRHTWTASTGEQPAQRWHVGWNPATNTYFAQVEQPHTPPTPASDAPTHPHPGMRGGWPQEGTVWVGSHEPTSSTRRVLVDEIDPSGLVSVMFVDPDGGEEGDLISPDRFAAGYTLIPPGDPRLTGIAGEHLADQLTAEAAQRGGMTGVVPQEGTVWTGTDDDTGQTHRVQVDQIEPEGGLVAVRVLDADDDSEEGATMIAADRFGTQYTLSVADTPSNVPDTGGSPVDVIGQNPGEVTTVAELQEQLADRVQIPENIRAQLAADEPRLPATRLRTAAAAGGHDEDDLAQRWSAVRARTATGLPANSGGDRAEPADDATHEDEEESQRQGRRGPRR